MSILDDIASLDKDDLLKALATVLHEKKKPNFCTNCGTNTSKDEVVERDGFRIDPKVGVSYMGRPIKLSKVQRCIMLTLASANGRRLPRQLLADRCCYLKETGNVNTVRTHISVLRRKLEGQGVPVPFRNDWDVGYYWEV